ncbi:hypothetical protein KJ359_005254 [Pestalotiopsis sp. 9143b]|nr:hypothetical protein KJ359_005254 [Pestalotiopsis sp. 9143b]
MHSKKVALVVGASRGIGRQIAIDLAKNGYSVVVAAKSISDASKTRPFPPDPNSPSSTISTVAREILEASGSALAVPVDTRDPASIKALVAATISRHGRLDAVVYNSGAVWWAAVEDTPLSRFQLMQRVNVEGLRFFRGKTAYAVGKVGMSVLTKGLAMDLARQGLDDKMAITSLWPAAAIESGATRAMTQRDPEEARDLRKATIFSDAVLAVLSAPARSVNGRLELDEDFLRTDAGVTDFSKYAVVPGATPRRIMPRELPSLAVAEQDDEGKRMNSAEGKAKL